MIRKLAAMFLRDFQSASSYRAAFLLQVMGPIFAIVSFYFIGGLLKTATIAGLDRYGGDYFSFALVGIVFASFVGIALGTVVSTVQRGQMTGTLEVVLTTRTSLTTYLAGSSLYGLTRSMVMVALYLGLGVIFLGVDFGGANILVGVMAIILSMLAMVGLGIISGSFILTFKQGDPISLFLNASAFILSGVAYPIDVLPSWMRIGSAMLPHTYALEALRMALLQGASFTEVAPQLGALALFAGGLLPLSLLVFRYATHRARREGSFAQF